MDLPGLPEELIHNDINKGNTILTQAQEELKNVEDAVKVFSIRKKYLKEQIDGIQVHLASLKRGDSGTQQRRRHIDVERAEIEAAKRAGPFPTLVESPSPQAGPSRPQFVKRKRVNAEDMVHQERPVTKSASFKAPRRVSHWTEEETEALEEGLARFGKDRVAEIKRVYGRSTGPLANRSIESIQWKIRVLEKRR